MSERSTAIAVVNAKNKPAEAERLPEPEVLNVPAALLLAAESVTLGGDGSDNAASGVFIHGKDKRGRVVGTDGKRLLIASYPVSRLPSWMGSGILVSSDGLKARAAMIAKGQEQANVEIVHVKGTHYIDMSDLPGTMRFRIPLLSATFPMYERIIGEDTFANLDADGRPNGQEWKPLGINSKFVKSCGELAKILESGLPKSQRNKDGMLVRSFHSGDDTRPIMFDFPAQPGVILAIMPMTLTGEAAGFAKETAALLAPAVKASIRALTAHATRQLDRSKLATSDAEREEALEKMRAFHDRIAKLREQTPGLAHAELDLEPVQPKPPNVEAVAEEKPQEQPEVEPVEPEGPKVKRTKVRMKSNKAA